MAGMEAVAAPLELALPPAPDGLQVAAPLGHGLEVEPVDGRGAHGVGEPCDVEAAGVLHAVAAPCGQDADAAGGQHLATLCEPRIGVGAEHVDGV